MDNWYVKPEVVLREEADEWGILFDPDTGHSLALNPVAISMFKAMREVPNVAGVAAAIRAEFENVPDTLDFDIRDLLTSLVEAGFIGYESA